MNIIKFNNSILKYDGKWLETNNSVDPYNPLNLPPNTVRVRTSNGAAPSKSSTTSYDTATLVSGTSDVYDVYKSGTSFNYMFYHSSNIVEVLGANTAGVTSMDYMFSECISLTTVPLFDTSSTITMEFMFYTCTSLTSVPLFDTSSVTSMYCMFQGCSSLSTVPLFNTSNVTTMNSMFSSCTALTTVPLLDTRNVINMDSMFVYCSNLTTIPLFDTSKVIYMNDMFRSCTRVQSGALALYQQASSQTTPPSSHSQTFKYCGYYSETGSAEVAQIPSSWGGTGT